MLIRNDATSNARYVRKSSNDCPTPTIPPMARDRNMIAEYLIGVLVQCDPSIKAILVKIDSENGNEFIITDIDDETVLIKPGKEDILKIKLRDALKDTVREPEESASE